MKKIQEINANLKTGMKRFRNGYSRRTDLHDISQTQTKKWVIFIQILSKAGYRAYFAYSHTFSYKIQI